MIAKEFIDWCLDKYEKEIDSLDFDAMYNDLIWSQGEAYIERDDGLLVNCIGLFSEFMLNNGINPLEYTSSFPEYIFCDSDITSITIPDGIEVIKSFAFSGCSHLKSIDLPSSLVRIERRAFSDCSELKTMKIPEGTEWIGDTTFYGCSNLKEITIPRSVKYIGADAICDAEKIYYEGTEDEFKELIAKSAAGCIDTDWARSRAKAIKAIGTHVICKG